VDNIKRIVEWECVNWVYLAQNREFFFDRLLKHQLFKEDFPALEPDFVNVLKPSGNFTYGQV
jgi:hypothetical protein